jgi:hypothetical protein
MPKDLDKYFDDFFETCKKLSLEEMREIAFNAKDDETRFFISSIIDYFIEISFNKALETEKY